MKNNLHFLRKVFATLFFVVFITNCSFSQSAPKWSVDGNAATSSDFLGTTNNEDLVFKTNNSTAFKIKANGNIILKSLEGLGNGLITIDNNGKAIHIPFTGDVNQVLLGDGTFGALPSGLWTTGTGGKIYYNGGKVGIGTATPNFKLDVDGDVRITQNLYLQGGLVISEKIETPKQMKARAIVADSIIMDSTKAIYGITNFKDDVKLANKLSVNGSTLINGTATVNGDFKTLGSLTLAGNKKLGYTPATATSPGVFDFGGPGGPGPILPDPCLYVGPLTGTVNHFTGLLQSYQESAPGGPAGVLTIGFDSQNGIIDLAGANPTGDPGLLINYHCGKDIYMCTGAGGYVRTGKNFEVGSPVRDEFIAVNVDANDQTGMFLTTSHSADFAYNTKLAVNRAKTKALAVYNNTTSSENFVVFGDGRVSIGGSYSNPLYMLAVKGQIIAEELNVKLNGDWPDYVFKTNYKLMSINELEIYLKTNNHLPEMPNEKEIQISGINTSEMITKLLKQQEELTLYIIEQNKRIEILEKENKK